MDSRERFNDPTETARVVQDAVQKRMHTSFPGIIESWNPKANTCVVQPAIKYGVLQGQTWVPVTLPLLLDCPVHFPAGGGVSMTFPIKKGDECLVSIAERCFNAWWQNGGVQTQEEFRMHDLSDGFVIPKVWSQPLTLPAISTDSAQIRTTDGSCFIELKEDGNVNVVTTQNVTITAAKDVTVNSLNATVNTVENVTVNAGLNIDLEAGQDITIHAKRDVAIIADRDLGIDIGRNWRIDSADAVNISSKTSVNINAPQINEN